jgi:vancomycin resistance protein YoaR
VTSRDVLAAGRQTLGARVATLLSPVAVHRDVRPALGLRLGPVRRLTRILATLGRPPVPARIALDGATPVVVPARAGRTLDRWRMLTDLKRRVIDGGSGPIIVHFRATQPRLSTATAREAAVAGRLMLSHAIRLTYDGHSRGGLQPVKLAQLLRFRVSGDRFIADLDPAATARATHVAVAAFAKPAKDATFAVNGNRVSVIASRDGFDVDPNATVAAVTAAAYSKTLRTADIAMGPALPSLTTNHPMSPREPSTRA